MAWLRGPAVGKGSSSTVSLALLPNKTLAATKWAPLSHSSLLQREATILHHLQDSPHIVSYLSHDVTAEHSNGQDLIFNLFLEFATGGSLADLLRRGPLPKSSVRLYTRSIVQGLSFVHSKGYVHCDVKPENILVFADGNVKIADFGLAKRRGKLVGISVRGTPMYMSPESVAKREFEPAMDIWALGCVTAEMMSGNAPWRDLGSSNSWGLMMKIGFGEELPEIPPGISEEGKDFLKRCFVRDPETRWTAEMLLNHPFVQKLEEEEYDNGDEWQRFSPRSVFGFDNGDDRVSGSQSLFESDCCEVGRVERRIGMLVTGKKEPDWWSSSSTLDNGGWISVRDGCFSCTSVSSQHCCFCCKHSHSIITEKGNNN